MLANKNARNGGSCHGLAAEDQPLVYWFIKFKLNLHIKKTYPRARNN